MPKKAKSKCRLKRFCPKKRRGEHLKKTNYDGPEQSQCHFDETQFEVNEPDGERKLRSDAIPLIFPTHVLVVHDPTGQKKWHSPQPVQQPPQPKQTKALNPKTYERKLKKDDKQLQQPATSTDDHDYAKNDAHCDLEMCNNFCSVKELEEIESRILGEPKTNGIGLSKTKGVEHSEQNGSHKVTDDESKRNANKMFQPKQSERRSMRLKRTAQTSPEAPSKFLRTSQGPRNGHTSPTKLQNSPVTTKNMSTKTDPPIEQLGILLKSTPTSRDVSTETDPPMEQLRTPPKQPGTSRIMSTETDPSMEQLRTPPKQPGTSRIMSTGTTPPMEQSTTSEMQVWDETGASSNSSEVVKDALSFLQFMLPAKWMAFSEHSGVQVVLLSKTRAKAIQRSVYVPYNGEEIQVYVHAERLKNKHKIFDGLNWDRTEPLTRDSVGDFVDRIINIIEVLSSYEVCCGVTDKEYLEEWREFKNCILDTNSFGEEIYDQTVRSVACTYLAPKDGVRCQMCDQTIFRIWNSKTDKRVV